MLVLGIDPGLGNTGYGIIKIQNNDLVYLFFGLFKTVFVSPCTITVSGDSFFIITDTFFIMSAI